MDVVWNDNCGNDERDTKTPVHRSGTTSVFSPAYPFGNTEYPNVGVYDAVSVVKYSVRRVPSKFKFKSIGFNAPGLPVKTSVNVFNLL